MRIATFEGSGPRPALDALQTQFYAEDLASLVPNIKTFVVYPILGIIIFDIHGLARVDFVWYAT